MHAKTEIKKIFSIVEKKKKKSYFLIQKKKKNKQWKKKIQSLSNQKTGKKRSH